MKKKQYHHGDLKKAIMAACIGIIQKEGIRMLSLRNVAAKIGVSHSALYRHYGSKEELVVALALNGFEELAGEMAAAGGKHREDPYDELDEMGRTYIRFAADNPVYYRLMFGDYIHDKTGYPELFRSYDFWFTRIIGILKKCDGSREKDVLEYRIEALSVWSLLHGYASLVIDNKKDRNVGSEHQVRLILKQLRRLV